MDVDQHIACELFHTDQSVPAFSVGPVQFLPRADWIDCFVRCAETRNIVQRVERRELSRHEVRGLASEGGAPADALTVITCLGSYSWVGTVRTFGHEFGQSHWKASILVGLAIDAVGLRFHSEEARRFVMAGRSHLEVEDRLATAVDDGRIIHGWSGPLPGLGSAPGELAEKMQEEREFLDAAGRVLDVYAEQRQEGSAPVLVERWVNALYWLSEARREGHDFMAVVKYGCALDGLSGGGGDSRKITKLLEAALAPREGDEAPSGALSLADAVEMVYREGRSALAHGGSPGLLEDYSRLRNMGDVLLAAFFYPVTLAVARLMERPDALTLGRKNAFRLLKKRLRKMP